MVEYKQLPEKSSSNEEKNESLVKANREPFSSRSSPSPKKSGFGRFKGWIIGLAITALALAGIKEILPDKTAEKELSGKRNKIELNDSTLYLKQSMVDLTPEQRIVEKRLAYFSESPIATAMLDDLKKQNVGFQVSSVGNEAETSFDPQKWMIILKGQKSHISTKDIAQMAEAISSAYNYAVDGVDKLFENDKNYTDFSQLNIEFHRHASEKAKAMVILHQIGGVVWEGVKKGPDGHYTEIYEKHYQQETGIKGIYKGFCAVYHDCMAGISSSFRQNCIDIMLDRNNINALMRPDVKEDVVNVTEDELRSAGGHIPPMGVNAFQFLSEINGPGHNVYAFTEEWKKIRMIGDDVVSYEELHQGRFKDFAGYVLFADTKKEITKGYNGLSRSVYLQDFVENVTEMTKFENNFDQSALHSLKTPHK